MAIVAVRLHWTMTLKTILRVNMKISVNPENEKFLNHLCAQSFLKASFIQFFLL